MSIKKKKNIALENEFFAAGNKIDDREEEALRSTNFRIIKNSIRESNPSKFAVFRKAYASTEETIYLIIIILL